MIDRTREQLPRIRSLTWPVLSLQVALVTSAFFCRGAEAAVTYNRLTLDQGERLLVLRGDFEPSDDPMKLVAEYVQFQPSFVTFDSNGGSVVAAMKIGRAIRTMNARTLQIRSTQCASACALAFLGGVERFAEAGSIGVHQAFFSDDADFDQKTAVATVQALTADIIGYLSDMGVDPKLLQLSLSIESSDMRYLTIAEMREWNIVTALEELDITADPAPVAPSPSSSASPAGEASTGRPPSQSALASDFVRRYHEAWSSDNPDAIAFMQSAYADQVNFYGQTVDKEVVLKDKEAFARRWPERIYLVKPGSETVRCSGRCDFTGIVEWFARSRERGRTSSGMAKFSLVWDPSSGKIEAESGKVIETDQGKSSPDRVISHWQEANSECRGSTSPESVATQQACARREEVGALLDQIGWCYGHRDEYGYQMRWHRCDANSNRPANQ